MTHLPRLKPNPIPAIHPLPEYMAQGSRKAMYDDTKMVLGVPWMGVVTMAFSHYPNFYKTLWSGIRPLCQSVAFQEACAELREFTEAGVAEFELTDMQPEVRELGYVERELDDIRKMIEVFAVGNMPYVLIATLARLLLQGGALSEGHSSPIALRNTAPGTLLLMERHHADAQTVAVYDDIQATLGLPLVNTDYRALARWPSYFSLAWSDLRSVILGADYEQQVEAVHHHAVQLVEGLPNLGGLDALALQTAANEDGSKDEVETVVQLFQWLLPGLVTNVACLQQQLKPS